MLGTRIKNKRRELGWTQAKLGKYSGLSITFLSDVENGKRGVSAENLFNIAGALGVSVDSLMNGMASENNVAEFNIPASLAEVAEAEGLSLRQTLALLRMHEQIVAYRAVEKKAELLSFDWRKFYMAVKEFVR